MTSREAKLAKEHFHIRAADGTLQPQPYRSAMAARAECIIGPTEIHGYRVVKVLKGRPCPCTSSVAEPPQRSTRRELERERVDLVTDNVAPDATAGKQQTATDSSSTLRSAEEGGDTTTKTITTPNSVRQDGRRRQTSPAARTCITAQQEANYLNARSGGGYEG